MAGALFLTAPTVAGAIVTEQPRTDLPIALDGQVWAVEQVGTAIVVGGNFTQVQTSPGGPIVNQAAIYAYDLDSGTYLENFQPILGGVIDGLVEVRSIEPTPDGDAVYIGGRFNTIDDRSDGNVRVRNRIAKLSLSDGRLDRNFSLTGFDASVLDLELDNFGRVYAGGNFTTAFDLAPNRPPIEQTVRGLARIDGVTGAFDTGFRYESRGDIGREFEGFRTPGVVAMEFDPARRLLFVAHRGDHLFNAATNEVIDSPGLARIVIEENSHFVNTYKALHPDPNWSVQEFYHVDQCNGRGYQVRDLDVGSNYVVLVAQGSDSGVQCDTATRFPTNPGQHRPDWVSRVFDSVFSVSIDGNDIYLGGHFRYLTTPSAPSPYPGEIFPDVPPGVIGGEVYTADPDQDETFREDLVDPGFVFPVGQLGALNATTGFGNPNFDPVSDAFLGVLDLTVIDRGLLIGQDRGRINSFNVGRSAFLDNNPTAGIPVCSVTRGTFGAPIVSWQNIGGVNNWNIADNGNFVVTQPGNASSFEHVDAERGITHNYELRYNRNGLALTQDCGSVDRPIPTLTCSARLSGDDAIVNWQDQGWSRASVFANGSFVAAVDGGTSDYTEIAPIGTTNYSVRAFLDGDQFDANCSGTISVNPPALACTATLQGDRVTVNWTDEDWSRSSIFRNDSYAAGIDGAVSSYTEDAPIGTTTYAVRAFIGGQRLDANCSGTISVNPPALACTATLQGDRVTVNWSDEDWSRSSIFRNDSYAAGIDGATSTYTEDAPVGTTTYAIRAFIGGQRLDATCGAPIVIAPASLACSAVLSGENVTVDWNDEGWSRVSVFAETSFVASVAGGTSVFTETAREGVTTYNLRAFIDGERIDASCSLAVNRAFGQDTSQSSTSFGGAAARAVDGNTSGVYRQDSVTHTNSQSQPWWQVDLGQTGSISTIELWNRTDCCASRLSNVVVFVSDTDMAGRSLAALEADPAVTSFSIDGAVAQSTTINAGTNGRYVRVQLRGTNPLSLAEVIVNS